MSTKPRIVLLHATPVAMEPIRSSMQRLWPEAEPVNLLDDALTTDRSTEGPVLSEDLCARFVNLGKYAASLGGDGILITCSAFGPAIDQLKEELSIPVLKPNEAMFREAIASGNKIGMLATFAPAVSTMTEEFAQFVAEDSSSATLETLVVKDAIELLRNGDPETHNRLVAEQAHHFGNHDAIMLAHFSTSRALDLVRTKVSIPVLSAPDAAVSCMRQLVTGA